MERGPKAGCGPVGIDGGWPTLQCYSARGHLERGFVAYAACSAHLRRAPDIALFTGAGTTNPFISAIIGLSADGSFPTCTCSIADNRFAWTPGQVELGLCHSPA